MGRWGVVEIREDRSQREREERDYEIRFPESGRLFAWARANLASSGIRRGAIYHQDRS